MRKPSNMGGSLRHSLKWDMMPLGFEPHSVRLPRRCSGKESTCQGRIRKRYGFNHWVRKIPWRKKWQPTPVFLLGKFCGQRSLSGYSPWGLRVGYNWATNTFTFDLQCCVSFRWIPEWYKLLIYPFLPYRFPLVTVSFCLWVCFCFVNFKFICIIFVRFHI